MRKLNLSEIEKTEYLSNLIDQLKDPSFGKDENKISDWIDKLNLIYANEFRHSYSDIYTKLQTIFDECEKSSSYDAKDALGENLNVMMQKISELANESPNDANLKNTYKGFKKFADHIRLEIGRYDSMRRHINSIKPSEECVSSKLSQEGLANEEIQKLKDGFQSTQLIAMQAKLQLDGLDGKLESNKISSITALTIFSAVILAFSGGITFEASVFQAINQSSPYRLVFLIALTGFVLTNTIFILIYLVGKLTGKSVGSKCHYMRFGENFKECRSCGEGHCIKQYGSNSIFCRIAHRYLYVLVVNLFLIYIMYLDFALWVIHSTSANVSLLFVCLIPIVLVLAAFLIYELLNRFIQTRRFVLNEKVDFLIQSFEYMGASNMEDEIFYFRAELLKPIVDDFLRDTYDHQKIKLVEKISKEIASGKIQSETKKSIQKMAKYKSTICSGKDVITWAQHHQAKKLWRILLEEVKNKTFLGTTTTP